MKKISVIVTIFNVEKYIDRCIKSVLEQSFSNFELIIVDDKTPDDSMAIAKKYADKDPRIKLIYNEENTGLMWARKIGYENACGDYVVFLDSDDTLPSEALKKLYDAIEINNADMVSGNIVYKKIDNSEIIWSSTLKYGNTPLSVYHSLLKNEYRHNLCGHIINRSLLIDYEYHTYKNFIKWEDYCLFYQLVKNTNKIEHIDEPVYCYYQTPGSSTQVKISNRNLETTVIAHKEAFDVLKGYKELENLLYQNYQYCFCSHIHKGYKNIIPLLKTYKLEHIISVKNIVIHNSFKQAVKLLLLKNL